MIAPSFRFRLERIRALRERSEDQAKLQLAGAIARRQECAQRVTAAAASVGNARKAQLHKGPSSSTDLLLLQAYLERAEKAHRSTLVDLKRHEHEVAGRRSELTAAARDRQALEHLKAHRLADHQRESARLEAVELDEIAINGFRRRTAI